jgi:homoserine kinase
VVTVRVPATCANMGPGFDVLGLALPWDNHFSVSDSDRTEIFHHGPYASQIPTEGDHLALAGARAVANALGRPLPTWRWDIEVAIPPGRGLGSSSSAVVGGLVIANERFGRPFTQDALLALATKLEGHPDNAAPALHGGVTAAFSQNQELWCIPLAEKICACAVVVVPAMTQSTSESRGALSPMVTREASVYNIAAVTALTHALLTGAPSSWQYGLRDQLHQPERLTRIPGALEVVQAAREAGAFGAVLSGSGPTLLALTPPALAASVAETMQSAWAAHDIRSETRYFDTLASGAQASSGPVPLPPHVS